MFLRLQFNSEMDHVYFIALGPLTSNSGQQCSMRNLVRSYANAPIACGATTEDNRGVKYRCFAPPYGSWMLRSLRCAAAISAAETPASSCRSMKIGIGFLPRVYRCLLFQPVYDFPKPSSIARVGDPDIRASPERAMVVRVTISECVPWLSRKETGGL